MVSMETTDLLFGALAILFVGGVMVLDRRLGRIQRDLERLDELTGLAQRVASLAGQLDRKDVSAQLEAKLTEIAEGERRMVSALAEVTRELTEMRRAAERRAAEQAPAPPPSDAGSVVRDHLAGEGFDQVRLVTDPSSLEGRSGKVVFEAFRQGVLHKGHVQLSDGRVVDQSAQASYSTFP
jgi:hypothetical protein